MSEPTLEHSEHGSDFCFCGDYRSQHVDGHGKCRICSGRSGAYIGCDKFQLAGKANDREMAQWLKYNGDSLLTAQEQEAPLKHQRILAQERVSEEALNGHLDMHREECDPDRAIPMTQKEVDEMPQVDIPECEHQFHNGICLHCMVQGSGTAASEPCEKCKAVEDRGDIVQYCICGFKSPTAAERDLKAAREAIRDMVEAEPYREFLEIPAVQQALSEKREG